jgi:hypothetical protein
MLKKSELGVVTIDIGSLKDEVNGQWFAITKKKDKTPRERGELQITIQSPALVPAKKAPMSISELEKQMAADFIQPVATIPHSDAFDKMSQLTFKNSFVSVNSQTVEQLEFISKSLELGIVKFVWGNSEEPEKHPQVELRLPRRMTESDTQYVQHPFCRFEVKHSSLVLRAAHKIDVNLERSVFEDRSCLTGRIEAKAISETNKNITTIRFTFMIDKNAVEKLVNEDDQYEVVPEYDPNELLEACKKGHLDKVQICLLRGDDVNYANESKETPLHKAVTNGNEDIITALVERGADPRLVDNYGANPVDIAEKFFKKNLIPILHSYQ